jgi:hypothetical protein
VRRHIARSDRGAVSDWLPHERLRCNEYYKCIFHGGPEWFNLPPSEMFSVNAGGVMGEGPAVGAATTGTSLGDAFTRKDEAREGGATVSPATQQPDPILETIDPSWADDPPGPATQQPDDCREAFLSWYNGTSSYWGELWECWETAWNAREPERESRDVAELYAAIHSWNGDSQDMLKSAAIDLIDIWRKSPEEKP